ncbi:hypothetical protein ASE41_10120 [Streptomyces sp. Root264]|nr:hypothetical protein ASE41_10120 [Streptomyces sp. Root264]
MSPAGKHSHLAGAEAEVDFGEVAVRLRGELVKCHLFCLRLSFSGKAVHRVFASGGQESRRAAGLGTLTGHRGPGPP